MPKSPLKKLQQQLVTACDSEHYATTVMLADAYLQLQPDSIKAMLDKAHALTKMACFDTALEIYEAALEKLPSDQKPDVIFGEIGNLHRAKGDFAAAAEFYQKQIDADPTDATGFLFLGTLLMQMGDWERSEALLRQGSECAIGCLEEVHYALGCNHRSRGQYELARASFEESLRINSNDLQVKAALKDIQQLQTL